MSWYRRLAELLELEGLTACVTEKTIFAGRYKKGVAETEEEDHLIVLMYVDDLLVVGDDENIRLPVNALSKKLRLKVTGKLEEKSGWVAQSRPDLCWLCSMLARGQAQPLAVHETAMRARIRCIFCIRSEVEVQKL